MNVFLIALYFKNPNFYTKIRSHKTSQKVLIYKDTLIEMLNVKMCIKINNKNNVSSR